MWDFFSGLFDGALGYLADLFDGAVDALVGALEGLATWLYNLVGPYFTALTEFLSDIFGPVWDVILGILYLLGQAIDVVILAVQVLLLLGQVVVAVGGGIIRTVTSLAAFNAASVVTEYNPYSDGSALVFDLWAQAGGGTIALVLTWAVWLLAAVAINRVLLRQ